MFKQTRLRLILFFGDMAVLTVAMIIASWLRSQLPFGASLAESATWLSLRVYALILFSWMLGFSALGVYNVGKNLRAVDELPRVTTAHAAIALAFSGALYFSFRDTSRLQILYFALISWFLLIGYRMIFRLILRSTMQDGRNSIRVLIVGAGVLGREAATTVLANHWTGLRLVGFVDDDPDADTSGFEAIGTRVGFPNLGRVDEAIEITRREKIKEVIITLPGSADQKLRDTVNGLQELRVNVRVVPDLLNLVFLRSTIEDFGGLPLVTLREPVLDPIQKIIKRTFDFVVSLITIGLFAPLMLIIAILVKFNSRGPVFFRQKRVGQNGRLFLMYKFRSMVPAVDEPDADGEQIDLDNHKQRDDPRVTSVGRLLRRFSLDELPQLFNVVRGDMSLVGPRPELPSLVDRYEAWQRKRFEVPQGMTGWWQVNGRSERLMHLHTEDDLHYIRNYSLWLDIQILWRTVRAVIVGHGAY